MRITLLCAAIPNTSCRRDNCYSILRTPKINPGSYELSPPLTFEYQSDITMISQGGHPETRTMASATSNPSSAGARPARAIGKSQENAALAFNGLLMILVG